MRGNNLTIIAGGTMIRGELFSQDMLMIEGGVEGNVFGHKVVIKSTGWVHGDVRCNSLSIEPGGVVDGAVKVSNEPKGPLGEGMALSANELPEVTAHTLAGGNGYDSQAPDSENDEESKTKEPDQPEA